MQFYQHRSARSPWPVDWPEEQWSRLVLHRWVKEVSESTDWTSSNVLVNKNDSSRGMLSARFWKMPLPVLSVRSVLQWRNFRFTELQPDNIRHFHGFHHLLVARRLLHTACRLWGNFSDLYSAQSRMNWMSVPQATSELLMPTSLCKSPVSKCDGENVACRYSRLWPAPPAMRGSVRIGEVEVSTQSPVGKVYKLPTQCVIKVKAGRNTSFDGFFETIYSFSYLQARL